MGLNRLDSARKAELHLFFAVLLILSAFFAGQGCKDQRPAESQGPKVTMLIEKPVEPEVQTLSPEQGPQAEPEEKEQADSEEKGSPAIELAAIQKEELISPAYQADASLSSANATEGYFKVQKGDTLFKIAGREDVYGDPIKWPSLFRYNLDKLGQMGEAEDIEHRQLPEDLELRYVTPNEAAENLKSLGKKLWVVNVKSEKELKKIVLPAIALMKNGYHAYIARASVKGEEWVRLRVGFFEKRSEAVSEGERIMEVLNAQETWAARIGEEELKEFGGY